jgi:hypothetical protein
LKDFLVANDEAAADDEADDASSLANQLSNILTIKVGQRL